MKKKQLVFRPTGEVRPPQNGELFLRDGNHVVIDKAHFDFSKNCCIYKAVEQVIDAPLWRAGEYNNYFFIRAEGMAGKYREENGRIDKALYSIGNYFETEKEAEKYADLIKFILTERLLDNPEFSAIIEKLKGELQ